MNRLMERFDGRWIGLASLIMLLAGAGPARAESEPLPSFSPSEAEAKLTRYEANSVVGVGEPAPRFQVTTLEGRKIDLDELRGKVVYLHFFTTWCGWCRIQEPYLRERIWNKYKNEKNFLMLWVSREEAEGVVRRYCAEEKYPYPIALDQNRRIYGKYARDVVPREFLIGADGKVLYRNGEPDRKAVEACFAGGRERVGYDELMTKKLDAVTLLIDAALAGKNSRL